MRRGDARAKLARPRVIVEQLRLRLGVEECVMLVLPVHRHQALGKLPQLAWRRAPPVKLRTRALAQLALKLQSCTMRLERRFDRCPLGAMAHLVGATPSAQCKSERVDNQ